MTERTEETETLKRAMILEAVESEPVKQGRSLVVTIGINEYVHWQKLKNAVQDAIGLQQTLIDKLGFSAPIPPLLNEAATKDAIELLIGEQLRDVLEEDDSLVVFFAGHGHTRVEKLSETGFIVPVDARRPGSKEYWGDYIRLSHWLEEIAELPARHILVILDSCHSGFALGEAAKTFRDAVHRYQQDVSSRRSRKVITSAQREQRALDGGPIPGHSLFTGTLINGFNCGAADLDGNGLITSSELGLFIQQKVGQASKSAQTPDFGSFQLDDRGEMVISLRNQKQPHQDTSSTRHVKFGQTIADSFDLVMQLTLTFEEMAQGTEVPLFTGQENITVKVPPGVSPGKRIRLKGKGKLNSSTKQRGDLYLQIDSSKKTIKTQPFDFEVVKVDAQGKEISRNRKQAEFFTENLWHRNISLEMVAIPGGEFLMGDPAGSSNEQPQHRVTIQPFFMGKFSVTEAQWRLVEALPKVELDLKPKNWNNASGDSFPVTAISWYEAVEFCKRLSKITERTYRLPSEAEWEYACRAGTVTPYHFGETIPRKLANFDRRSWVASMFTGGHDAGELICFLTKVGSFKVANDFGLYDMHGNVEEWCADYVHSNYQGAPVDGSAWVTGGDSRRRVTRGGSHRKRREDCRSASRGVMVGADANFFCTSIGFRVVCELEQAVLGSKSERQMNR